MKHLRLFEEFVNERKNSIDDNDLFPNLKSWIEAKLSESKRRTAMFISEHRLLIGYYPTGGSLGDKSKFLPKNIVEELQKKFEGKPFVVMTITKSDPITNKPMNFTAISSDDAKNLKKIDSFFNS